MLKNYLKPLKGIYVIILKIHFFIKSFHILKIFLTTVFCFVSKFKIKRNTNAIFYSIKYLSTKWPNVFSIIKIKALDIILPLNNF